MGPIESDILAPVQKELDEVFLPAREKSTGAWLDIALGFKEISTLLDLENF